MGDSNENIFVVIIETNNPRKNIEVAFDKIPKKSDVLAFLETLKVKTSLPEYIQELINTIKDTESFSIRPGFIPSVRIMQRPGGIRHKLIIKKMKLIKERR